MKLLEKHLNSQDFLCLVNAFDAIALSSFNILLIIKTRVIEFAIEESYL